MKINKEKLSGMALFDGVIIRSKYREATARRSDSNNVAIQINSLSERKSTLQKIPFVRGCVILFSTLKSGFPTIISSLESLVNKILKDEHKVENYKIGKLEIGVGIVVSILLFISTFIFIPILVSTFFSKDILIQNIIQVSLQALCFVIYLFMLGKIKELQVLFEYHAAEHKVINAYEKSNKSGEVDIEYVKKASRFHRRCGSNVVFYVVILFGLMTFFFTIPSAFLKMFIEILLLPVIVGVAYEIFFILSLLPRFLSFITFPFMLVQLVTTKHPTQDKLLMAMSALRACLSENSSISVKDFIDRYIKENESLNINTKDILKLIESFKYINVEMLYANMSETYLNIDDQFRLDNMLYKLYVKYVPLQYLIGKQSFYHEEYIVTEDVLVPRADSELLVETAIKYISANNFKTMIDVCTGSGCIGVSTAKHSNIESAILCDISDKAVEIAKKNIIVNGANLKCTAVKSDLLRYFLEGNGKVNKYDIIVSNPPYIKEDEINNLSQYVQNEPRIALNGGKNGIDYHIGILEQAQDILNDLGYVIFEIGYDQKQAILDTLKNHENYEYIECLKDLGGNDRVIVCRFHKM